VKQAPRRTCVGCRTTRAKPELVRIVATPQGVRVDPDHVLPGRGAYVCPDPQCLDAIERTKGHTLRRALRTPEDNERGIAEVLSELHRRLEAPEDPTTPDQTTGTGLDTGTTPAA
jgi:predicted RNA-binding protein YlxR (DUF448 family)